MTSPAPQIDPLLVDRLSTEFAAVGRQLESLGQHLGTLREQLVAAAPSTVAAQAATPAPTDPAPLTVPAPGLPSAPPIPLPPPSGQPVSYDVPGVAAPLPAPAPVAREPWWQRDGVISRVLAVAGAGVTLIGVVLLLVLAAQAGLFGPQVRVAAGAVFAAALIAAGMRVFGRSGGRVGGIALAATGIAGAYLDVVAVTTIYGWLAPALGLVIAFGVAGAGLALAARWRSQAFALLVVVGAAGLAPFVTGELSLTLITFLIALQIACIPVHQVKDWPYLHVARTVPVVLALLVAIAGSSFDPSLDSRYRLLAAAVVVAMVGVASTLVLPSRHRGDITASAMLAVSALPLLATVSLFDPRGNAVIQGTLAAGLLVVAAIPALPSQPRIAALATGGLALLQTALTIASHDLRTIALLAVALGLLAVAAQTAARAPYFTGLVFALFGGTVLLDMTPPTTLASQTLASRDLGAAVVVAAALALAVLYLLVREAERLHLVAPENVRTLWLAGGLAGLYAATAGIVAAGVAAAGSVGFIAGHCVATIMWMVAASAALVFGLRATGNEQAALVAGLSLTAAALTKLFVFDLATLDGVSRVAAFIIVGLLLLAAGTRYARAFAERDDAATTTTTTTVGT